MNKVSKPWIIAIEDNPFDHELIRAALEPDFLVTCATTHQEFETLIRSTSPDLILLDVRLPGTDGMNLLKHIKSDPRTQQVPVFFVSGVKERDDRVAGLGLGAEDYITKPFDIVELKLKVANRLKRTAPSRNTSELRSGDLALNPLKQTLSITKNGIPTDVAVTSTEFRLLHLFVRNPGKSFTRDQLRDTIWGNSVHISIRTIDTHIKNLRNKLGTEGRRIQSIHGVGFALSDSENGS